MRGYIVTHRSGEEWLCMGARDLHEHLQETAHTDTDAADGDRIVHVRRLDRRLREDREKASYLLEIGQATEHAGWILESSGEA